ncbi:MAG: beta-lactamase family protein [Verrucomicrobiae bacterium]|nr:beta-lactamase family protein [Verrucomicrobiae bacterium]
MPPLRKTPKRAIRSIAAALQPYVVRGWMAGAVTLVADRSRILSLDAVGWADRAKRRRMTPDTLFWIASITKPITGAGFMMLVDEGKARVGDPVVKYLPEFADLRVVAKRSRARMVLVKPRRKVVLRDLLTHTSGMPMHSPLENPTMDRLPLDVAARSYAMTPLEFHPGRRYAYSNAGINTLGRVMEVAGGRPYAEFLKRRLFHPLGMKDASFVPTRAQLTRLATSYTPNPARTRLVATRIPYLKYPLDDPSRQPVPGGGLFATARDLARFAQMVLRGGTFGGKRFLSRASALRMTRRHTSRSFENGYGLGWHVEKGAFGHAGAFGSKMFLYPEQGLIMIFLVQHDGWLGEGDTAFDTFRRTALETWGARTSAARKHSKTS